MFLTLLALLIAFALLQKGASLSAGGGSGSVSALAAGAAAALPGLAIAAFSAREGAAGLAAGSTVGAAAALIALGAGAACLIRPVREKDNRLPAFALTTLTASAAASAMLADGELGAAEAWILLLPGAALVASCIAAKDAPRISLRGGAAWALGALLLFIGGSMMTIRLCAFASESGIAAFAVESALLPACLACPAIFLAMRGSNRPDAILTCLAAATLCLSVGIPASRLLGGSFTLSYPRAVQSLPYLGISAAACGIPIAVTGRTSRILGGVLLGIGAAYTALTMLTY